MKWKVLIVDDTIVGRNQAEAALVRVLGNHDYQQERREKAGGLFEVARHSIAGAAIAAIKAGFQPDLAIVDIDFQELDSQEVQESGFDPELELGNLRGFDVLAALEQYSPHTTTILFTGKSDQDDMIANELRQRDIRQGRDYFIKRSKAISINELAVHLADSLGQLASNLCECTTPAQRKQLRDILHLPEALLLDKEIPLGNRTLVAKSLLAHTGLYEHQTGALVFTEVRENLTRLLALARVEHFEPNGWWQLDFIHQAILDWRADDQYERLNAEIDADASKYALNTILYGQAIDIITRTNLDTYIRRNQDRFHANTPFGTTFINALILRRVLLGLSYLAQEPIWGEAHNVRMDRVLDFFMNRNHLNATPDNMRNFFSQVRGLSIATLNLPQSLNARLPYILEEENRWLQKYPPLIVNEINEIRKKH